MAGIRQDCSKIAVTGASGFIGGQFVLYAKRQGSYVVALIRKTSDATFLEKEEIPYIRVDFSNAVELTHALSNIEKVVHIAGPGLSDLVAGKESQEPNIYPLIKSCIQANISRFVYLSTIKAGSPQQFSNSTFQTESFRNDIYGTRKRLEEQILLDEGGKLNWIVIRAPAVYGPLDKKILPVFKMSQRKIVPILPESKCSKFSIIHTEDLSRALYSAVIRNTPSSEVLEIGNHEPVTWNTLVRALMPPTSKTITIPYSLLRVLSWILSTMGYIKGTKSGLVTDRLKDLTKYNWISDTKTASERIGCSPTIQLRDGLKACLEQYIKAGAI